MEPVSQADPTEPRTRRVFIIISTVAVLAVIVAGAAYMAFNPKEKEVTLIRNFACADGSRYLVIDNTDKITVSGQEFARAGESVPARYENGTDIAFVLSEDTLAVVNNKTEESIATCTAQAAEVDFVKEQ